MYKPHGNQVEISDAENKSFTRPTPNNLILIREYRITSQRLMNYSNLIYLSYVRVNHNISTTIYTK